MCQHRSAGPLRVAVIIGSTREGRVGGTVARWFIERAAQRADLELDVIDLAEFEFPARYPDQATPEMAQFAAQVDRADAFVVVTPEYNRSFPAPLKQAIDYASLVPSAGSDSSDLEPEQARCPLAVAALDT